MKLTNCYCHYCTHFFRDSVNLFSDGVLDLRCRAFPCGIPSEFKLEKKRHDTFYPGQVGTYVLNTVTSRNCEDMEGKVGKELMGRLV